MHLYLQPVAIQLPERDMYRPLKAVEFVQAIMWLHVSAAKAAEHLYSAQGFRWPASQCRQKEQRWLCWLCRILGVSKSGTNSSEWLVCYVKAHTGSFEIFNRFGDTERVTQRIHLPV